MREAVIFTAAFLSVTQLWARTKVPEPLNPMLLVLTLRCVFSEGLFRRRRSSLSSLAMRLCRECRTLRQDRLRHSSVRATLT
jgi:hypothetical protein